MFNLVSWWSWCFCIYVRFLLRGNTWILGHRIFPAVHLGHYRLPGALLADSMGLGKTRIWARSGRWWLHDIIWLVYTIVKWIFLLHTVHGFDLFCRPSQTVTDITVWIRVFQIAQWWGQAIAYILGIRAGLFGCQVLDDPRRALRQWLVALMGCSIKQCWIGYFWGGQWWVPLSSYDLTDPASIEPRQASEKGATEMMSIIRKQLTPGNSFAYLGSLPLWIFQTYDVINFILI